MLELLIRSMKESEVFESISIMASSQWSLYETIAFPRSEIEVYLTDVMNNLFVYKIKFSLIFQSNFKGNRSHRKI